MKRILIKLGCIKAVKRENTFNIDLYDNKMRILHPLTWVIILISTIIFPFFCLFTESKLQDYAEVLDFENYIIW